MGSATPRECVVYCATRAGAVRATKSVLTALRGGFPDNVYNKDVIPRWDERFGGQSLLNGPTG